MFTMFFLLIGSFSLCLPCFCYSWAVLAYVYNVFATHGQFWLLFTMFLRARVCNPGARAGGRASGRAAFDCLFVRSHTKSDHNRDHRQQYFIIASMSSISLIVDYLTRIVISESFHASV